jgi:hypothetical protein
MGQGSAAQDRRMAWMNHKAREILRASPRGTGMHRGNQKDQRNPSPLVGEQGHAAACGRPASAHARSMGRKEGQG